MMGVLLLLALAADPDPRAILDCVAAAAKSFTSQQVTAQLSIDNKGPGIQQHVDVELISSIVQPNKFRVELKNGISPMLMVFDGKTGWIYLPALKKYSKVSGPPPQAGLGGFGSITSATAVVQGLVSARFIREESVEIAGEQVPCYVVHAEYERTGSKSSRELWIDKNRDFIVREQSTSRTELPGSAGFMEVAMKMAVTSLKLNGFIPDQEFSFTPPADAIATTSAPPLVAPGLVPGPPVTPGPAGAYRVGGGVTAPNLIYKVEPKYSEEARQAKIEGTVVLYVVVGSDGTPRDMRVIRGLGHGLDENAVAAVAQWRFQPGQKDGHAVAVAASIEVNFRLLQKPTSGP